MTLQHTWHKYFTTKEKSFEPSQWFSACRRLCSQREVQSIQSYRLQVLRAYCTPNLQLESSVLQHHFTALLLVTSCFIRAASATQQAEADVWIKKSYTTSLSAWFAAGHSFAQVNWKKETDCPPEAKLLNKKWLKFSHQVHIFCTV